MGAIRWYGPTLVLVCTVLVVMIAGPGVARRMAWAYDAEKIRLISDTAKNDISLIELNKAFRNVATIVEPSVVHIDVSQREATAASDNPFNRRGTNAEGGQQDFRDFNVPQVYANGSGWVYDARGHIITNYHVVEKADVIQVRFVDGAELRATLVGYDLKTDVAVLKVNADNLHVARRATEPVAQGEIVFAFGSPFKFEFSMSQGIVSAVNRRNVGILNRLGGYENFIQTDAAINPGNSGGPLTNIHGEVIGMNTAIPVPRGRALLGDASFSGLGFAIPVDMVVHVADQLIATGKVSRGYLGIYIKDLDPVMAETFGYDGRGVLVETPVEGGAAEEAGIQRGDIIRSINGKTVTSADELRDVVSNYAPGTELAVELFRDGKVQTLKFNIDELPNDSGLRRRTRLPLDGVPTRTAPPTLRMLGIESISAFTPELGERAGLDIKQGVVVRAIRRQSVAENIGLYPEQIITHVMSKPVDSPEALVRELESYDLRKGVRISVIVDGLPQYMLLTLPEE